jgi:hypothetical protein
LLGWRGRALAFGRHTGADGVGWAGPDTRSDRPDFIFSFSFLFSYFFITFAIEHQMNSNQFLIFF